MLIEVSCMCRCACAEHSWILLDFNLDAIFDNKNTKQICVWYQCR